MLATSAIIVFDSGNSPTHSRKAQIYRLYFSDYSVRSDETIFRTLGSP